MVWLGLYLTPKSKLVPRGFSLAWEEALETRLP